MIIDFRLNLKSIEKNTSDILKDHIILCDLFFIMASGVSIGEYS